MDEVIEYYSALRRTPKDSEQRRYEKTKFWIFRISNVYYLLIDKEISPTLSHLILVILWKGYSHIQEVVLLAQGRLSTRLLGILSAFLPSSLFPSFLLSTMKV